MRRRVAALAADDRDAPSVDLGRETTRVGDDRVGVGVAERDHLGRRDPQRRHPARVVVRHQARVDRRRDARDDVLGAGS